MTTSIFLSIRVAVFCVVLCGALPLWGQITYPLQYEKLNSNLEGAYTVCMAEGKNGSVLIGTPQGCYRSIDNGATWQPMNTGLTYKGMPDLDIRSMVSTQSRVLFLGTPNNLYRSYTNGDTWESIGTFFTDYRNVLFLNVDKSGVVFVGVTGNLFASTDSGQTWGAYATQIKGTEREGLGRIVFGKTKNWLTFGSFVFRQVNNGNWQYYRDLGSVGEMYADSSHDVFLIVSQNRIVSYDDPSGVGSGSGTITYTQAYTPPITVRNEWENSKDGRNIGYKSATGYLTNPLFFRNGSYMIGVADYGIDSVCYVCSSTSVRGDNYKYTKTMRGKLLTQLLRHSDGSIWAGTFGGGVHRTTDNGVTWTLSTQGLKNPCVFMLYTDPLSSRLFVTTGSGFYVSTNRGTDWRSLNSDFFDPNVYDMTRNSRGELFAVNPKGVYVSTNNGNSWQLRSDTTQQIFFRKIVVADKDTLLCEDMYGYIYRSINHGRTWTAIPVFKQNMSLLGYFPKKRTVLANSGYNDYRFYTTSDAARSWQLNPADSMVFNTVAFCLDSTERGYAMGNDSYFNNLGSGEVRWEYLAKYTRGVNTKLISKWNAVGNYTGGMFYSTLYGIGTYDWNDLRLKDEIDGLDRHAVLGLCTDSLGYLYAGTLGGGIYRTKRSTTELLVPEPIVPTNLSLDQPSSRIDFSWKSAPRSKGYDFQLSTKPDFSIIVKSDVAVRSISRSVLDLQPNTTYYWRSRTRFGKLASPWSEVWTFKTGAQLPAKLKLTSPPNNSIAQPTTLALEWQGDVNAEKYHLQVRKTSDQTIVVDDTTLTALTRSFIGTPKTSYSWQVRAIGALGAGAWSDAWQFTTEENTSVASSDEEGGIVIIPNPLSEWFQIQLPTDKEVSTVTLTDIRGVEVYRGTELRVQTSSIPNGVYVVSVRMKGSESTPLRRLISVVR